MVLFMQTSLPVHSDPLPLIISLIQRVARSTHCWTTTTSSYILLAFHSVASSLSINQRAQRVHSCGQAISCMLHPLTSTHSSHYYTHLCTALPVRHGTWVLKQRAHQLPPQSKVFYGAISTFVDL